MKSVLPISLILPTRNRSEPLKRMLNSLAKQSVQPIEAIIVDGSTNPDTQELSSIIIPGLATKLIYYPAESVGAASQRNQGCQYASQNYIMFCDDDILFEPECISLIWKAMQNDLLLGGVNATITNQQYSSPGRISRGLFEFLSGEKLESYAGRCIGPALNLLPEDREDLPEVVPVEWLNTTCVLYRREALPEPLFPNVFRGYSLMEDVTLSLTVAKNWKLANARTARIFHDSQPGDHKNDPSVLAEMDLVNRHYVMTQILGRQQWHYYLKLSVLQLFGIVASLTKLHGWFDLPKVLMGKMRAIAQIIST